MWGFFAFLSDLWSESDFGRTFLFRLLFRLTFYIFPFRFLFFNIAYLTANLFLVFLEREVLFFIS